LVLLSASVARSAERDVAARQDVSTLQEMAAVAVVEEDVGSPEQVAALAGHVGGVVPDPNGGRGVGSVGVPAVTPERGAATAELGVLRGGVKDDRVIGGPQRC